MRKRPAFPAHCRRTFCRAPLVPSTPCRPPVGRDGDEKAAFKYCSLTVETALSSSIRKNIAGQLSSLVVSR